MYYVLLVLCLINFIKGEQKDGNMKNKVKKSSALLALLSSFLMPSALASTAPAPYIYDTDYEYENAGNMKIASCSVVEDSSLDFCDPKIAKKLEEFSNKKPNFGPEMKSVLTKFWDKELNAWFFVAVNTETKVAHAYPRGLRSAYESNNLNISFGKADKVCTKDIGMDMVGDRYYKSYSDESGALDYCSSYNDKQGFTNIYPVDSKTKQPTGDEWL